MDKSLQLDILYLQVVATLFMSFMSFMSLDYFLTDSYRMKLDAALRARLEHMRKITWADFVKAKNLFIGDRRLAATRIAVVATFIVCGAYERYIERAYGPDSLTMGVALLTVLTMFWTLWILSRVLQPIVLPLVTNGPASAILYVVGRSRKGPMAATGMGCLALSFIFTYYDLTRMGP